MADTPKSDRTLKKKLLFLLLLVVLLVPSGIFFPGKPFWYIPLVPLMACLIWGYTAYGLLSILYCTPVGGLVLIISIIGLIRLVLFVRKNRSKEKTL